MTEQNKGWEQLRHELPEGPGISGNQGTTGYPEKPAGTVRQEAGDKPEEPPNQYPIDPESIEQDVRTNDPSGV